MNQSVIGTKSMVVSPHYLASMAGNRILLQGGNAFDAAIAVSACLAVVYPHMTGLGGDSFWLTYCNQDRKVRAYNGSGRSGYNINLDTFANRSAIPVRGIHSAITVPGMVDSWEAVHREYGRLEFREVLQPAIQYAEQGFPVSSDQHVNTTANFEMLSQTAITSDIFVPGQRIPKIGERFYQKQIAQTLKEIAVKGKDVFYKGTIAQIIVDHMKKNGGFLTLDDFTDHHGEWVEPISTHYKDYTVHQVPPNSQGFTGLMTLNILKNFDMGTIEHGSYEYYHLLVEALKLSFRDRNRILTDPDFSNIPLNHLLSDKYASELAKEIQKSEASEIPTDPVGNDTAYAAVMDDEGNSVSFIQSLYFEFGSGITAGDTGILLQNRGSFFSLNENHVNCLQPHKRTFHTLMPAMACIDNKPRICFGTQGGEGQPQTQMAIFTRMVDYGMDPQRAINEPRWVWGRTWGAPTQELKLEKRIDTKVVDALSQAGHKVQIVKDFDGVVGHAHAIMLDESGFLQGGSDPRSNGAAIGW